MLLYVEYGANPITHIDLAGTGIYLESYSQGTPVSGESGVTVTDTYRLVLPGKPEVKQQVEDLMRAVEWLSLRKMRRFKSRTYLYFQPVGYSDVQQAETLDLRLEFDSESAQHWIGKRAMKAALVATRTPWTAMSWTELPLTNHNDTGATGGIQIENCDDASHDNHVAIDGADILGDMRAPAKIEIADTYASDGDTFIWMSLNAHSTPGTFAHQIEGEAAAAFYGGSAAGACASCSGGNMADLVIGVAEAAVADWTISSAQATAAAGNEFHLLTRWDDDIRSAAFRWSLLYGTQVVWQQETLAVPDTNLGTVIRDMGLVRIPPWDLDLDSEDAAALTLRLAVKSLNIAHTLDLDFIQLLPVDGFRLLQVNNVQNDRVVDDGYLGIVYTDTGAGTARKANVTPIGKQLQLWPGRDQKIYFLVNASSILTAEIGRTHSVRVYYRPRRAAL